VPSLTASQLTYLANELSQYAGFLNQYASDHSDDPGYDNYNFDKIIKDLTGCSSDLARAGTATVFNDTAVAYQSLLTVTSQAIAKAHEIEHQTQMISRIAGMASGFIGIAVGLASGNVGSVWNAVSATNRAMAGN